MFTVGSSSCVPVATELSSGPDAIVAVRPVTRYTPLTCPLFVRFVRVFLVVDGWWWVNKQETGVALDFLNCDFDVVTV